MGYSKLATYKKFSPNCTKPRQKKIKKIIPHHMAGKLTVEACGEIFAKRSRNASSNYGIDSDGRIAVYVDENNRAYTTSDPVDHEAVTIEVANSKTGGNWPVSDEALDALIDLCVDICKRNGIKKLNYTGDKSGNLLMHKWYAATACPGPYLASKFPYIEQEVNKRLGDNSFKVKFKTKMNVRVNAGTNSKRAKTEKGKYISCLKGYTYTIVKTKKVNGVLWGKLKSGNGWVCIAKKYCTRL